ncbi:MAG TPA: hypothetical protein VMR81_01735 [Patescibacteria group bacterium]|jgi:hypothetical protein|nr:hypothetical protein [Patescibacteria group bacterium]
MTTQSFVFDVQGVVTYPSFKSQIIEPLEQRGATIRFWSLVNKKAEELLRRTNLDHYIPSLIDLNATDDLYVLLRSSIEENAPHKLEAWLAALDLSTADMKKAFSDGKKLYGAFRKSGIVLKYPPLLGDGPHLLVESDNAYVPPSLKQGIWGGNNAINYYREAASDGGFSCLFVPEHPGIWQEAKLRITPEEIMETIKEQVLNWNGEVMFHNVAELTGLYHEGNRGNKEQI